MLQPGSANKSSCEPTQNALLRWWGNDESIWSVFFGKLLVEPEEVAEASPHGEGLVAEHLQRGLKHTATELKRTLQEEYSNIPTDASWLAHHMTQ